jgi:hypothetical protein
VREDAAPRTAVLGARKLHALVTLSEPGTKGLAGGP